MLPPELLVLAFCASVSHAVKVPLQRRTLARAHPVDVSALCDWEDDPFAFTTLDGLAYTGTIHLGDTSFNVQLDTGSSDLWLDTANRTLNNLTNTGHNASILYESLVGVSGGVDIVNLTFGKYTFPQAFINAPNSNATNGGQIDGVLGLGAPIPSEIRTELGPSAHNGASFITNLFQHYPDVPNFLTFLLERSSVGESDGGVFTIGELVPKLESVVDEPPLPAITDYGWATLIDAVIINGVTHSGNAFPFSMARFFGNPNQTVAVLDTGTSTSTAPPQYVDAMYKHLPGARFDSVGLRYHVPCDTKLNVSIVFAGGRTYPMHPIDLVVPDYISNGSLVCAGAFEYEANNTGVDFLLGDSFLRNVYSLFDFGRWTTPSATDPHMKLLSLTDPETAWAEFDTLNAARSELFMQWNAENASGTGPVPGLPLRCTTRNSSLGLDAVLLPATVSAVLSRVSLLYIMELWLCSGAVISLCFLGIVALQWCKRRSDGYQLLRQDGVRAHNFA